MTNRVEQVREIKNISGEVLTAKLPHGAELHLPPGVTVQHVSVVNLGELSGKVAVTRDLGEVRGQSGRNYLKS